MPIPAASPIALQPEVLRISESQLRVLDLLAEQLAIVAGKNLQGDAENATSLQQIGIALNSMVFRIRAEAEKSSWQEASPTVSFSRKGDSMRISAVSTSTETSLHNNLACSKARLPSTLSKLSSWTGNSSWISARNPAERLSRQTCLSYQTFSSDALVTARDIKSSDWELLATPFHVKLSSKMIISSRLGAALERRRCLSICILILLGLSLIVEISQFSLGTPVRSSAIVSGQQVHYHDRRPAMGLKYFSMSLMLGSTCLCFHRANRQILLRSVLCFDPFILFASLTLYQCMSLFNRHRSLGVDYDTAWMIMDILQVFSLTGAHLLIANIDSFSAARKFKIWFSSLILSFYCFQWITARCFEERWGEVSDCRELEIDGATRRELYLQFLGQATVFLFKALCGIFSGHIFATIRPSFVLTKSWMDRPAGIMTEQDLTIPYSPHSPFVSSPSPSTPTRKKSVEKSPDRGERSFSNVSGAEDVQAASVTSAPGPPLEGFKLHTSLADVLESPRLTGRGSLPRRMSL